jgi:hypothetical protein
VRSSAVLNAYSWMTLIRSGCEWLNSCDSSVMVRRMRLAAGVARNLQHYINLGIRSYEGKDGP